MAWLGGCAAAPPVAAPADVVTGTVERLGLPWATAEGVRRGAEVTWTFAYADLPPTVVTARLDADGALAAWTRVAGGVEQAALERVGGGYAWSTRLRDGEKVEGLFDVPALRWPLAGGAGTGPTWTGAAVVEGDGGFRVDAGPDGLPVTLVWPDGSVFVAGATPAGPLVAPDDLAWPTARSLARPREIRRLVIEVAGARREVEAPLAAEIPARAEPAGAPPPLTLPTARPRAGLGSRPHLRDQLREAHRLTRGQLGDADCKAQAARAAGLLLGAGVHAEPVHGWVYTEEPTPAFRPHAWVRVRLPGHRWLHTDPALDQLVADATHVEDPPDLPPGAAVRVREVTWTDGSRWPPPR